MDREKLKRDDDGWYADIVGLEEAVLDRLRQSERMAGWDLITVKCLGGAVEVRMMKW